MFGDINRVEILGNVTRDPELKYTTSGAAVLNLGMATNRRIKRNEEWVDEAEFHNIVIWGNLATNLSTRVKKGTRMFVAGRVQTRSWDDDAGKKNYRTEIHVYNNQDVILLARYEGSSNEGDAPTSAPRSKGSSPAPTSNDSEIEIDPDDLPF